MTKAKGLSPEQARIEYVPFVSRASFDRYLRDGRISHTRGLGPRKIVISREVMERLLEGASAVRSGKGAP